MSIFYLHLCDCSLKRMIIKPSDAFWVISICGSQNDAMWDSVKSGHERCIVFQQLCQNFWPSLLLVPTPALEWVVTKVTSGETDRQGWNTCSWLLCTVDQSYAHCFRQARNPWEVALQETRGLYRSDSKQSFGSILYFVQLLSEKV